MKPLLCSLLLLTIAATGHGQSGRIYTAPDPEATGGIEGKLSVPITHALAVDRGRTRVYQGELDGQGSVCRFKNLPVGRYDLVCVGRDGTIYEGLELGGKSEAESAASKANLEKRIATADTFFNRHVVHRIGLEGDTVLALVERLRDATTLKQSGEKLEANVRRIEIIELERATDDWQMTTSRHIYREAESLSDTKMHQCRFVPAFSGIRVVDTIKDIGAISLQTTPTQP